MTESTGTIPDATKPYLCPVCNRITTKETCDNCEVGTEAHRKTIDGDSCFPRWVRGVIIALVSIQFLMMLLALLAVINGDDAAPGLVLVFFLSIIATIVVVLVIYVLRLHLRERELLRRVKEKPGIGVTTVAIAAVFAAIPLVSLAMIVVNSCQAVFAADAQYATFGATLRILAGLSYAGFFPLFALAVMTVATKSFVEKLDRECPRPIFLDESKLADMAFKALIDQIEIAGQAQAGKDSGDQSNSISTKPQRLGIERTARGGIKLVVRGRVREQEWDDKTQKHVEREKLRDFVAETDEWGNIVSVRENSAPKPWEGRPR